ncbi:MAG: arsenate reductase (glutaredoxin) [Porticoccaceae bacterium]|nr:arsenate reductase (glutaredoxin) [Porticoccaceae bacterium]
MTTLYHNPRCSKSRLTLALLRDRGIEPQIILYLEQQLDATQLQDILDKLDMRPRELLRRSDEAYKRLDLKDLNLSDKRLLQAMLDYPKLIQRPIVVRGKRAVIGRPPENVLNLL